MEQTLFPDSRGEFHSTHANRILVIIQLHCWDFRQPFDLSSDSVCKKKESIWVSQILLDDRYMDTSLSLMWSHLQHLLCPTLLYSLPGFSVPTGNWIWRGMYHFFYHYHINVYKWLAPGCGRCYDSSIFS